MLNWVAEDLVSATNPPTSRQRLDILFDDVYYFEVTPRQSEMPLSEDLALECIFLLEASEDLSDYIQEESIPVYTPGPSDSHDYHMVFRFNGGHNVRVGAASSSMRLRRARAE